MTTEGTRLAKNKWSREHMGTVSCRVDKETKEKFISVCRKNGRVPNEVLKNLLMDYIVSDGKPWQVGNASAYTRKAEDNLQ